MLIYGVNFTITVVIVTRVIAIDNDKGHLVFLFYYPVLILLNLAIGLALKLSKKSLYKSYWKVSAWMAALFVPIYIALTMY